ncbi:MAG: DUF2894 domain-containing protein, partial [Alcanivorax sp.]|nr:DUF2894 domain-containing protein [Alcanivorax sp.]
LAPQLDEAQLAPLQQHYQAGDYLGLQRRARRHQHRAGSPLATLPDCFARLRPARQARPDLQQSPLEALLRQQEDAALGESARPASDDGNQLHALQALQGTRARLHSRQRIQQALASQPDEAGPLNSHRQVTRALQTLQDISPAYLKRFANYVDTLMWLEKAARRT